MKDKTKGGFTHNPNSVWNTLVVENFHNWKAQPSVCPKGQATKQVVPTFLQTPPCPISKLKCDSGGNSSNMWYCCLHGQCQFKMKLGMIPSKGTMERWRNKHVEANKSVIKDFDWKKTSIKAWRVIGCTSLTIWKWLSIFGLNHGRCIYPTIEDVLILNIDPLL